MDVHNQFSWNSYDCHSLVSMKKERNRMAIDSPKNCQRNAHFIIMCFTEEKSKIFAYISLCIFWTFSFLAC